MFYRRVFSLGEVRRPFVVLLAVVLSAAIAVAVPPSPVAAQPASSNILFLGDSITAGDCIGEPGGNLKPYYTYRDRLLTDLAGAQYIVDSVGWNTATTDGRGGGSIPSTLPGDCFANSDTEHGSYPGLRVDVPGNGGASLLDDVTANIGTIAAPQIVLVLGGINDLASGDSPAQVAADIQALVTAVLASAPSAQVFVGTVLDHNLSDPDIGSTDVADTNLAILGALAGQAGVTVVDTNAAIDPSIHLADAVHLNQAGAQVLADTFRLAVIGSGVLDDGFTPPSGGGDNVSEIAKLLADDNLPDDRLGFSVAVDGITAIAGAYSTSGSRPGGAYIFEKFGGVWSQTAKLQPANSAPGDQFGWSVDLDGDTAIVGSATSSQAHVFVRSGSAWTEQQMLVAGDGDPTGDEFGFSVAVSGDTAVVGARLDDTVDTDGGAAYVFERAGEVWSEVSILSLPGTDDPSYDPANTVGYLDKFDNFGWSVAIDGTTVAVGAPWDDVTIAGGTAKNNLGSSHVFVADGGSWILEQSLLPGIQTANDQFGLSVSVSTDRLVVGAPFSDPSGFANAGRVYVLDRAGGNWTETTSIVKPNLSSDNVGENFGYDVDVDGLNLIASAFKANLGGNNIGDALYVADVGGTFTSSEVRAADGANADFFGRSVSISGDELVVGAEREDGTPGTPSGGNAVGAVYAFSAGPDTTPPTWSGGALVQLGSTATTIDLSWSGAAADASYYGIFQDGARLGRTSSTSFTIGGLRQDTSYNFSVEAYDGDGNVSTNGPSVVGTTASGDTVAPTWPTNTITVSNLSTTSVDLSWPAAADDSGVAGYILSLDGVPLADGPAGSFSIVGLEPGTTYVASVVAYDAAGNQSSLQNPTQSLATEAPADTVLPTWTGGSLVASSPTDSTVDLVWSGAGDDVGVVDYVLSVSVAGGGFVPLVPDVVGDVTSFTATGLLPATEYQFRVEALDAAGNESTTGPVSGLISTVSAPDTQVPTWTGGSLVASNPTATTVDLVWSGAADNVAVVGYEVSVSVDGGVTFAPLATVGDVTSFTATGLLPATEYQFRVEALDAAGNESTTGPVSGLISTVSAPDTQVPTWTGGSLVASNPTATTVDLLWSGAADNVAVVGYEVSVSVDGGVTFAPLATVGDVTSFVAAGLSPATEYQFRVEALDAAGNESTTGPVSGLISTISGLDTQVPTWTGGSLVASSPTDSTVDLVWSGAGDDVGVVDYVLSVSVAGGGFVPLVPDVVGDVTSFTATGLLPATEYQFRVEALDAAGNQSTTGPVSGLISTLVDAEVPTWTGGSLVASNPTATTVDLVWSGAADNVAVVGYEVSVSVDGGVTFAPLATVGDVTSFTATGLLPATEYQFRVEALDAAGNESTTGPVSGLISTLVDAEVPTWTGGSLVASNPTATTVDLVWSGAADNVAVVGYEVSVSVDGGVTFAPLATVGDVTSFVAAGLLPATEYQFRVEALDAAGNESTTGPVSGLISTVSAPDTQVPTWTGGSLVASSPTDSTVDLVWSGAGDDVGVVDYVLSVSVAGGGFVPLVPDVVGDVTSFTATGLLPATEYQFRVEALDAAGNESTTGPVSGLISTLVDAEVPTWTGGSLVASNPTATTVDLVWSGAADNVAVVGYEVSVSVDGGVTFAPLATVGDVTSFTATGLLPATEYQFRVEALDAAGNESTTGPVSGLISTLVDAEVPTWTAGSLVASDPTDSTVNLSWAGATDNVDVVDYALTVSLDGGSTFVPLEPNVTGPVTSFVASGLSPETTYVFQIEALDAAGNVSTGGPTSGSVSTIAAAPPDPINEIAKLVASDADPGDNNGYSVAIDGDIAVAGAPKHENNNGANTGAVYVFERQGATWVEQAILTAGDPQAGDFFGWSVAVDDGTIVVGAYGDDQPSLAGSVYVFTGSGSNWTQEAKLRASDAGSGDRFGQDVAIDGDTIVVGAHLEDTGSSNAGSAYVFARSGASWVEQGILRLPDSSDPGYTPGNTVGFVGAGDRLGWSVDVSGDTAVVGAPEDTSQVNEVVRSDHGSANVFVRDGAGNWTYQATLVANPPRPFDKFGWDVAIDGDRVLAATPFNDKDGLNRVGLVYEFERTGTTWAEIGQLRAADFAAEAWFGYSVALDGDRAVVGAPKAVFDNGATGVAYSFAKTNGTWSEVPLIATDRANADRLGWSVSVDGTTAMAGAWAEDGIAGTDQGGSAAGSAYTFSTEVDETAPIWPENALLTASNIGVQTVELEWPAAIDSFGVNEYVVYQDSVEIGRTAVLGFGVTGLVSETSYQFAVAAVDVAGNTSLLLSANIQTIFGDSTAPTWTNPVLTVSSETGSSAALSWSGAEDDVAVTSYKIFRDGTEVGEVVGTTTVLGGLAPNSTFTITVQAVDAAGNNSTDGPSAQATTTGLVPVNEIAKLVSDNPAANDRSGYAMALDGNTVVAGAYQRAAGGSKRGSAFVFENQGGTWVQQAELTASDGANNDFFGWSVDISGDTIVVGAYGDDNPGLSGAAYVFVRSGSTWSEQIKLKPAGGGDRFGQSVAIDGDTVVVGAHLDDDAATNAGAGYVFERSGTDWIQQAKLVQPDNSDPNFQGGNSIGFATSGDNIGWSADISGDTVVLGSPLDDSNVDDTRRRNHGSAYVFVRDEAGSWSLQQALSASNLSEFSQFGYDVAIDGDRIFAGAPFHDSDGLSNNGAAYEFERTGTTWTESTYMISPELEDSALFGWSVGVDGSDGVIGSYRASFSGINEPGAAYSLSKQAGLWSLSKLVASDAGNFDRFGYQVDVSDGLVAVGAFAEDGFDGTDQGAAATGSVYVFDPALVVPLLSISDVTVNEADGLATLTVSIDTPQETVVEVDYSTADGTAAAGADYTNSSDTLQIPALGTSATIDIPIVNDSVPENNESFAINLSNATEGIGIAMATATVDILNDDGEIPVLSVASVEVTEGDSGTTQTQLIFDLDRVPPVPVTVDFATQDGSAVAPSDYASKSGTITFDGVQQVTESFEIVGDVGSELDETFTVALTSPSDGVVLQSTSATVTITNDDGVLPVLSVEAASTVEGQLGQTSVSVTFSLVQPVTEDVTFDFATIDGSAVGGEDYLTRSGSATISQGATSVTESFVVFGDVDPEPAEAFSVAVSNVLPAQTDVVVGSADVIITNDDFTEVIIDVFAGDGNCCNSGDGGLALDASLNRPRGVRADAVGNVYFSDPLEHVVRRIDAETGIITTVAGTGVGGYSGDNGPATSAQLKEPYGLAFDDAGNLYIGDIKNNVVRKVDTSGVITTYAGGAGQGFSGDGGPATSAKMFRPMEVEWHDGALYIADYLNHKIRRVDDATGIITTVVGLPSGSGSAAEGFSGDGGPADQARLKQPRGMAFTNDGDLIFADRDNNRIRRVDTDTNIIETIAGTGAFAYGGDGGMATDAKLKSPRDVKIDAFGNIYIADTSNRRIRVIDPATGIIETYAGTGQTGGSGDGGPALDARLGSPYDLDIAPDGRIFIADELTSVRKIRVIFPANQGGNSPTWPTPSLIQTGQTSTSVDVQWSAAVDDGSVSGYDVFVDGAQVGTTASTSFTISGLAAGSSYTVTIEAEDGDGNRSTTGPSAVITTDP